MVCNPFISQVYVSEGIAYHKIRIAYCKICLLYRKLHKLIVLQLRYVSIFYVSYRIIGYESYYHTTLITTSASLSKVRLNGILFLAHIIVRDNVLYYMS